MNYLDILYKWSCQSFHVAILFLRRTSNKLFMNLTATSKFCCIRRNSENLLQETNLYMSGWNFEMLCDMDSHDVCTNRIHREMKSYWFLYERLKPRPPHLKQKKRVSIQNHISYNMRRKIEEWVIEFQVQKRSYIFILSALNENLHGVNCRKWHKQELEGD